MHRRALLLSLLAVAFLFSNAPAQDKKSQDKKADAAAANADKGKYQNAEVVPFTAQDGVKITPEQLKAVTDSVVKELQDIKRFKQVAREGETLTDASAPTLKITGTITKFQAGSRAKRYFIGFGAGKTKVVADVKYIDRETGAVLHEFQPGGMIFIGLFGGDSGTARSILADKVAHTAKKKFF